MPVECSRITGSAGTGKTQQLKCRVRLDEHYGVLTSTTGISAVNLGTVTLNSTLGYFDADSLRERFLSGRLEHTFRALSKRYQNLLIDEDSMLPAEQLDFIYQAVEGANATDSKSRHKVGIVLAGDFLQLPPIKSKWAFEAECWPEFERNTTRLMTFWRQDNKRFLEFLGRARAGDGRAAADMLADDGLNVEWSNGLSKQFPGTTIVAKNEQVDRLNWLALKESKGTVIKADSERWGKARPEWKHIPEQLVVREGSYVMLLANSYDRDGTDGGQAEIQYANGDCGYVRGFESDRFLVELIRGKRLVEVRKVKRLTEQAEVSAAELSEYRGFYSERRKKYVLGGVAYYPIRLAYASTVHKCQSLTLDRIQIDLRDGFMGHPGMCYVALSRVRGPEGLRLVGFPDLLRRRIKMDERLRRYV